MPNKEPVVYILDMKRYLLVLIFLLLHYGVSVAEEQQPGVAQEIPDLLDDGYISGEYSVPDLLGDEAAFDEQGGAEGSSREDVLSQNTDDFVVYDPLEPMNRVFFEFNDKLYFWILKPVKNVYSQVFPADIRLLVGNFFTNLAAPVRLVNNILQGEFDDAGVVLGRFLINTTIGVGGLGDPALTEFDIEPRGADFGQTLAKWGIGEGVYFFWPAVGPSSLRDTFGMAGDVYLHPVGYVYSDYLDQAAFFAVDRINVLSLSPDVYEDLKRISLDPYIASREAYYEYRRQLVRRK